MPRMDDDESTEIEQAALRLLACREHSRGELRRKLRPRSSDPGLLERVLDALEEQHALSDERFVEQYAESRRRKGFGPLRIRRELGEKGVDKDLVESWLQRNDQDWWEQLQRVACSKFGEGQPADFKERARRARFLEYRGFPPEQIRRFLWP